MDLSRLRAVQRSAILALLVVLALYSLARPVKVLAALEYNQRIELNDDFDSCTGETIRITGTQHIVGRITTDAAGRQHFGFTRSVHGTGVGLSSGARYVLTDAVTRASLEMPEGDPITYMEQYHTHLIRQGEAVADDDLILHFLSKFTVNANGELTASVELLRVVCR